MVNLGSELTDVRSILRKISVTKGNLALTYKDGSYILEELPNDDYSKLLQSDTEVVQQVMNEVFSDENGGSSSDYIESCLKETMGEVSVDFNEITELPDGYIYWLRDVSSKLCQIYLTSNFATKTLQIWV